MEEKKKEFKRIVIKLGSNVLTDSEGEPNMKLLHSFARQVGYLTAEGVDVVIVSSGAVAFGKSFFPLPDKTDAITKRQISSAVGQINLFQKYTALFQALDVTIAQILVTKEDFRSRRHYNNMKNCLLGLLDHKVVPIINENDATAVTELMFTDNDELAGLLAAMVNADTLFILTNVDGIFTGHPDDPDTRLIQDVKSPRTNLSKYISHKKSSYGRGGMMTKIQMAKKTTSLGIDVFIANGCTPDVVPRIINGDKLGTHFHAQDEVKTTEKWLAHADDFYKGIVVVNDGARDALLSDDANSLLPVGIVEIKGIFSKGDILNIKDEHGESLGLGKAAYGSKKATELIGKKNQKPLIHYDYLYLYDI